MRAKLTAIFAMLLLVLLPAAGAHSAPQPGQKTPDPKQPAPVAAAKELAEKVRPEIFVDTTSLFLPTTVDVYRAQQQKLATRYDEEIVIVFVKSLSGADPMEFADDFFDYGEYGIGAEKSGILMLVATRDRTMYFSTKGKSIKTFTDYGLEVMKENVGESLGEGDWGGGVEAFLAKSEDFMARAAGGKPFDVGDDVSWWDYLKWLGGGLVVALLGGGTLTLWLEARHKTARQKSSAEDYLRAGSVAYGPPVDQFLTSVVTRTPIESKDSSSGGSSTHTSSSGSTHGGSGGRF